MLGTIDLAIAVMESDEKDRDYELEQRIKRITDLLLQITDIRKRDDTIP